MTYETKSIVENVMIPCEYKVYYHQIRGYDSPDRWFEVFCGDKKIPSPFGGYCFGKLERAIDACILDKNKKSKNKKSKKSA